MKQFYRNVRITMLFLLSLFLLSAAVLPQESMASEIWTWGLGWDGLPNSSPAPMQASGLPAFVAIAPGEQHTVALDMNGYVWAWGSNNNGQLGDVTSNSLGASYPVQSTISHVVAVSAGSRHTLALKDDGTVWAWGWNYFGQIGSYGGDSAFPLQIWGLQNIVAISAGNDFSLALKKDGTVWAWGHNNEGQLGIGAADTVYPDYRSSPIQVSGLFDVVAISAGMDHAMALKRDGTVWTWGTNYAGNLGDTRTPPATFSATQVPGVDNVAAIAAGNWHSVTLKNDGTVWSWGANYFGQLGDGTFSSGGPTPVQALGLNNVLAIAASSATNAGGMSHALALKNDNTVWAWGHNESGQVGDNTIDYQNPYGKSAPVQSLITGAAAVAAGGMNSLAIQSGSISGTISYTGVVPEPVTIMLWTSPPSCPARAPAFASTMAATGRYTIPVPDGVYYVGAVMPMGPEGQVMPFDPSALHGGCGSPTAVTVAGSRQQVDLELLDSVAAPSPFYHKYSAKAYSIHTSEGYSVRVSVSDPFHQATSVYVICQGITNGNVTMTYDAPSATWTTADISIGTPLPATPLPFTFIMYDQTGQEQQTATVQGFVGPFATDLSPSGISTTQPQPFFTWNNYSTPVQGFMYDAELYDQYNNKILSVHDVQGTFMSYVIPYLAPMPFMSGQTYTWQVKYKDQYGDYSITTTTFLWDMDDDGDGTVNVLDNCRHTYNPDQLSTNGFGFGDACTVVQCVSDSAGLQTALSQAQTNGMYDVIKLVQGTYGISGNNNSRFSYQSSEGFGVAIEGGYTAACQSKVPSPDNTILDGENINIGAAGAGVLDLKTSGYEQAQLFVKGITIRNGRADAGAGLYANVNVGTASVENSVFRNNTARSSGGAMYLTSDHMAALVIRNNVIQDNSAGGAYAGIHAKSPMGSVSLIGNVITGNVVTSSTAISGAGVRTDYGTINVVNNTIAYNRILNPDGFAAGLWVENSRAASRSTIYNNIFWGNEAKTSPDLSVSNWENAPVDIQWNDFDPARVSASGNMANNIMMDPWFQNPSGNNFRLASSSALINVGSNVAPGLPTTDVVGHPRITGGIVDIGAYEYADTYVATGWIGESGIGLAGVTVNIEGPSSATAQTDATGTYFFTDLISGTYVVTPSHPIYKFTPLSTMITITDYYVMIPEFVVSDVTPPTVSINPVATPTYANSQVITGRREAGAVIAAAVNTPAMIGPVAYPTAETWRCEIAQMTYGENRVTITATDAASNSATVSAAITYIPDMTPPIGSLLINNGSNVTNSTAVTLTITCSDPDSGCSQMQLSSDGTNFTDPEAIVATKNWVFPAGDDLKVVLVKFSDTAGNWSDPIPAAIVLDTQAPTGFLAINAAGWQVATIDNAGAEAGQYVSAKADAQRNMHMSYIYHNGFTRILKYATNVSGQWETAIVDDNHNGEVDGNAMTLDSSGKAHIAYTGGIYDLKYATNASGTWQSFTLESQGDVGRGPSIAVDGNNKVHIAYYYNASNGVYLKYATNVSGQWQTSAINAAPYGFGIAAYDHGTAISLDPAGKVHVCFVADGNLYHALNTNGQWDITSLRTGANDPSMAIDPNGTVHVSYRQNGVGVMYMNNATGGWASQLVTAQGGLAQIAIDGEQNVHISYLGSMGRISYATNRKGPWLIYPDIEDGIFTSISVDSANTVAVAYLGHNRELKIAQAAAGALDGKSATNNRSATFLLAAQDDNGVDQMQFSTDAATWSDPEAYATTKAWTLDPDDGVKTVYAKFRDTAGNWTVPYTASIVLDTVAPSVNINMVATPTKANTQTIAGNRAADAEIAVAINTTASVGSVAYPTATTWMCTIGQLAEGANVITVTATDVAHNSATASTSITYDSIVPMVSINPVATPTNVNSQTITGDREIGAVVVVAVTTNATAGLVTYPTVNTWSCVLSGLAEEVNGIVATATDAAGNSATAAANIILDSIAPVVTIASPVTGLTKTSQPVLTYTASDGTTVVRVDGIIVAKQSGTTLDPLTEGPHTVRVEAIDAVNNMGYAEVSFLVDTVAPNVAIDPVATPTRQASQTITGTRETDSLIAVAINTTATAGVVSYPTTSSWSCAISSLAEGTNAITITATDAAGNSASALASIVSDSIAPVVTIASPVSGITGSNALLLTYAASDGTVVVKVDGVAVSKVSGSTLDALADGPHVIRIESIDGAGNVGSAEVAIIVDTIAPIVTINSPASGLLNSNTPFLSFTTSDGTVVVKVDNAVVNKVSGTLLAALADGPHTVRIEATDGANNRGYAEVTFTVDTVSPVVAISSPLPGLTINNKQVLAYTVSDGTVTVKVDGVVKNKVSGNTLDLLDNGPHTIRVESMDVAGNTGSAEVSITVNYTPMTIATTSLAWGVTGSVYSQNLTANGGVPPYTWLIQQGSLPQGLNLNPESGVITGNPTAVGSSTFTVLVQDQNLTTISKAFTINVYAPLAVTTTALANGFVGAAYSQTVTAEGGLAPYTWSVTSGSLPNGLNLNPSTGVISGTPTAVGSSSFYVQAQDANLSTATKPLSITISAARPDLVVTALSGPTSGTKGNRITVTATVRNQGQASAGSSTLTFYLSLDGTVTSSDIKLGDKSINTLSAGGSQNVNVQVTIPSSTATGTYYIGAIADRTGIIAETNEGNNTRTGNTIAVK